jgi:predicted dehydrogenase
MHDDVRLPRVAFAGLGWIGRHRLQAVVDSGLADIVGLADSDPAAVDAAHAIAPRAAVADSVEAVLDLEPDGLVIATPSALHASQGIRALDRGSAVFCQKPLGRNARETASLVNAARRVDRLLGVDFSYRQTAGLRCVRDLVGSGALGDVYAVDLTFHNAYGPDKPWFYDARQAGGGCLLDLGTHLVDFLHWSIPGEPVHISSALYTRGRKLRLSGGDDGNQVEDFAIGQIELAGGAIARLACSWGLAAGCDAAISIAVFGTRGGAALRNVNGSFYDFVAERYTGTKTDVLCAPPDDWGGRAIVAWVRQLARSGAYDPAIETAVRVAETLDALYGRSAATAAHSAA